MELFTQDFRFLLTNHNYNNYSFVHFFISCFLIAFTGVMLNVDFCKLHYRPVAGTRATAFYSS